MFQRYNDPTPGLTDIPQAAHLEPPAVKIISITGQLLCSPPPPRPRHLGYERVKIDVRAALHRRARKQERREVSRAGWWTAFPWPLYLWTNTKRRNWLSLLKTVNYRESLEISSAISGRNPRPDPSDEPRRPLWGAPRVHSALRIRDQREPPFINCGVRRNDYRLGAASGRPGALLRTRRPSHTLL